MDASYDVRAAYPATRFRLRRLLELLWQGRRDKDASHRTNGASLPQARPIDPELHGSLSESELVFMSVF
ncbi:MAG TPA: hypothetical protein VGR45_04915 [Stellaceae bacterium]|nr:hypothetical protein [Stellaceae bacterium]